MNTTQSVIIVAGGKGLRMGGELPKQFIPIGGKPVLMHTIEAFYNFSDQIRIILVLPESHQSYWEEICKEYNFTIPHQVALGGDTRFQSVKNGLRLVGEGIVGVHDGARPFVSIKLIETCYEEAATKKAVIPAIPATDSLRELIDEQKSKIVDRSKIVLVQTPQVFDVGLLKKAYNAEFNDSFTDDASVVEAMGAEVCLVKGESSNIKMTTPIDLKIGALILKERQDGRAIL